MFGVVRLDCAGFGYAVREALGHRGISAIILDTYRQRKVFTLSHRKIVTSYGAIMWYS